MKTYYAECCSLSNVGPMEASFGDFLEILRRERQSNTVVWHDGSRVDVMTPVHNYEVYEVVSPSRGLLLGDFDHRGFVPCATPAEKTWRVKIPAEKLDQAIAEMKEMVRQFKRRTSWGGCYETANLVPYSHIEKTAVLKDQRILDVQSSFKLLCRLKELVERAERSWSDWYWREFILLVPNANRATPQISRNEVAYRKLAKTAGKILATLRKLRKERTN